MILMITCFGLPQIFKYFLFLFIEISQYGLTFPCACVPLAYGTVHLAADGVSSSLRGYHLSPSTATQKSI